MNQTAAVLAMLLTVAATVAATKMPRDVGFSLIALAATVSLAVLGFLGADVATALTGLAPLLLIVGYAMLALVLVSQGVAERLAAYVGPSPLWVFAIAAVASVVLSNDVVIVAFAPLVLTRRTRIYDAAALYVGANVTGGLLPQGSPTNLLVLGQKDFFGYLGVSAIPTAVMVAVAVGAFVLLGRWVATMPSDPDPLPTHVGPWTTRQRWLVVVALVAIAAQPACDLLGVPRGVLGWCLVLLAMGLCYLLDVAIGPLVGAAPWQIGAVVAVLSAGAAVLGAVAPSDAALWPWAFTSYLVSAGGTDILAAALAGADVQAGLHPGGVALVVVTAGAFATPVGSISGLLLLEEYQRLEVRPQLRTFVLTGAVSFACFLAGATAAAAMAA